MCFTLAFTADTSQTPMLTVLTVLTVLATHTRTTVYSSMYHSLGAGPSLYMLTCALFVNDVACVVQVLVLQ